MFEGTLFRAATRVLSPSLALMGIARTWNLARRGSTARTTMGPRGDRPREARVTIEHASWLYGECQLQGFEEAFAALAEELRIDRCTVERESASAEETVFRLRSYEE